MASGEKVYRVAMLLRSDQDRVKEILGNQYLDCTFDYYQVDTLEAVRTTCLKICDIYDGILTSGLFSHQFISCYSAESGIPHRYFAASVENYYRQILLQTMHNPNLSLGGIHLDLMTERHNLPDILEENRLGPLMQEERTVVSRMTPEEVLEFEREMVGRHIRSIQNKDCQLFMTRSTIAAELFQSRGVPYIYVRLTSHEIFKTVDSLRREMERKQLKDSQVASIHVGLDPDCTPQQMNCVWKALEQFGKIRGTASPVFMRQDNCFEAITDAQTICALTRDHTYSELSDCLITNTGLSAAVGYGIGTNVQDARENAITAAKYALSTAQRLNQTFLIDSSNQIIPLKTSLEPEQIEQVPARKIFEPAVNEIAQRSHLSSRTVFSLMMALQKQYRREVDSEWIMRELNVSMRMANKILANLENAGYAYISGKKLPSGKGRPSNIHTLCFDGGRDRQPAVD